MTPAGAPWLSWPKKSSGLATDLHRELIRAAGLETVLVALMVCALNENGSGLKFVIRHADRPKKGLWPNSAAVSGGPELGYDPALDYWSADPMKMLDFLERIPPHFAQEILESLPAPDRKDLLRRHNAKAKLKAGSLNRAVRAKKEARNLIAALKKSDLDSQRTFLQGWLARRADMIVYFLNAWEIDHQNGIVDSFDWVEELEAEKVKESLPGLAEMNADMEPIAPLIYFAYLELPCTEAALDVDALIAGLAPAEQAS